MNLHRFGWARLIHIANYISTTICWHLNKVRVNWESIFGRGVSSVKVRRRPNKATRACHESLTTSKVTFVCRPGHCLMSNKLVCENKYKHSSKEALEMLIKRFCEEENSWIKNVGIFPSWCAVFRCSSHSVVSLGTTTLTNHRSLHTQHSCVCVCHS